MANQSEPPNMRNDKICLRGDRLVLVPYLKHHVARYHEWMSREDLLEATCSEQQTLDEEYENQTSWMDADDKMTFILLAPLSCVIEDIEERRKLIAEATHSENTDIFATPLTVCAPSSSSSESHEKVLPSNDPIVMVGDCNLFKMPVHHTEEGEVEVSVMLAEPRFRGKGLAREAVGLIMSYAYDHLRRSSFVAKILASNEASRALFEKGSLGFTLHREVKAFDEIHYMKRLLPALDPADGAVAPCTTSAAAAQSSTEPLPSVESPTKQKGIVASIDDLKHSVGYRLCDYSVEGCEVCKTMALTNETETRFY